MEGSSNFPVATLPLVGAGGEPVRFARLIASHGVATLPPNVVDKSSWTLTTTLPTPAGPRTVVVFESAPGTATVELVSGGLIQGRARDSLLADLRTMLGLDEDLAAFYHRIAGDELIGWAASRRVFEDVVKTICTTNCGWSATKRMVGAIVAHLGEGEGDLKAFPTAEAMAEADDAFYRDVARAGYRGAYLRKLATSVADGSLDLEALRDPSLTDDEVEGRLLALPGVGPYAAAHLMLTALSRYGYLVLDSWTRPTWMRLHGKKMKDEAIRRRFRRYRPYDGLAFWLALTKDWVDGAGQPTDDALGGAGSRHGADGE